ncbi:hypothetical protein HUJ04_009162 [Dendroctonus ponderosae]
MVDKVTVGLFIILMVHLAAGATMNHSGEENEVAEQKATRIRQNPFAPFAIPILVSEDEDADEKSANNPEDEAIIGEAKNGLHPANVH